MNQNKIEHLFLAKRVFPDVLCLGIILSRLITSCFFLGLLVLFICKVRIVSLCVFSFYNFILRLFFVGLFLWELVGFSVSPDPVVDWDVVRQNDVVMELYDFAFATLDISKGIFDINFSIITIFAILFEHLAQVLLKLSVKTGIVLIAHPSHG